MVLLYPLTLPLTCTLAVCFWSPDCVLGVCDCAPHRTETLDLVLAARAAQGRKPGTAGDTVYVGAGHCVCD